MTTPAQRWRAVWIGAAALAARLLYIACFGRHVDWTLPGDHISYNAFARVMMSGWSWFRYPLAVREPLYPAFMALAYTLPTGDLGTLQVFQAIIGAAAASLLYLGLIPYAGESVAMLSSLFVAFHPHFVPGTIDPTRENLVIPLIVAFVVTFFRCVDGGTLRRIFAHAFVLILLIHTDVRFLPLAVTFPFMALAYGVDIPKTMRLTLWMALFTIVLMIPYQVRQYVAMGHPVIVTERFMGRWLPWARAVSTETTGIKREQWLEAWEKRKRASPDSLTSEERAFFDSGHRPPLGHAAIHWFLFKEYWRFAQFAPFYRPYPDGRFGSPWSLRHDIASAIVVLPFLVLLPVFFFVATESSRRVVMPLLVYLIAHNLLHVLVHSRERYRIPLEVIMGIVVAATLTALWDRFRSGRPANVRGS